MMSDAAEAQIRRVLAQYVRAIDRLDWDLLRTCYHPDAIEDRGRYRGSVDGLIGWLREVLAQLDSTWHMVGTPLIELDGGVAWVETYCLAIQRRSTVEDAGVSETVLIPCRYCDRFECRDGDWRIARRVAVYEPTIVLSGPSHEPALGAASRRDFSDSAYLRDSPTNTPLGGIETN
jgi:hypothetical protein